MRGEKVSVMAIISQRESGLLLAETPQKEPERHRLILNRGSITGGLLAEWGFAAELIIRKGAKEIHLPLTEKQYAELEAMDTEEYT